MNQATAKQRAEALQGNLNNLLAQKAMIDEQILALRNMIQGINLGTELEKEIQAEAQKEPEGVDLD